MDRRKNRANSKELVISYAFAEFATHGYQGATLNRICSEGHISKGLLYHYFTDKDALYLTCVEKCFQEITGYLSSQMNAQTVTIDHYFDSCSAFFSGNPLYNQLFCNALINPPTHLADQILTYRTEFDELNLSFLTSLLEKEPRAKGINTQKTINQLRVLQDFLTFYIKVSSANHEEILDHNQLCKQVFHTMFYALLAQEETASSV